jgi:malonate transporter
MASLVDILAPVIAMIALGFALARLGVITAAGEAGLSNLVFYATTPALLFRAMAGTAPVASDLGVMAAYFGPCLLLYGTWALVSHRVRGDGLARAGIGAMGASFGNTVLLGVPIVERAYGAPGLRLLVMIVSIHSALLFSLTTLLAESDRGRADGRATLVATARMMARNPIVMSIAAGALVGAAGIAVPGPLDAALALLGGATTPVALVAVGAGLAGFAFAGEVSRCAALSLCKLVVLPAGVWAAAVLLRLDPLTISVATLAAALPTGTNVYILARRYEVGVSTAAGAILMSTLFSALTVPLLLAMLG